MNPVTPLGVRSGIGTELLREWPLPPVSLLKCLVEHNPAKFLNESGETETSQRQLVVGNRARELERAIQIPNAIFSQKSPLKPRVVRPLFYGLILHHVRDELLIEDIPHGRIKDVCNAVPTGPGSDLQERKPRCFRGPVGNFRVDPQLRFMSPRRDRCTECVSFDNELVRGH